jgi:predicted DNA-binding transcriptional regulator AlpA
VDALVGAPDIAERLGLSHPETVHNWIKRDPDFPKPVAAVSGVRAWNWPDVKAVGPQDRAAQALS